MIVILWLCGPAVLFMLMLSRDAPWYEYIALLSSVVFGMFLGAKYDGQET